MFYQLTLSHLSFSLCLSTLSFFLSHSTYIYRDSILVFNKGIVDEYFISNFYFLSCTHTLIPRSFLSLTDSSILSYYIFHFHLTLSVRHGMSVISHMHFHHTYSLSSHASHTDSLSSHIISNIIYLLSLLQYHLTRTLITHALYSLSSHFFYIFTSHILS